MGRAVLGVETGATDTECFRLSLQSNLDSKGFRGVKLVVVGVDGGLCAAASRVFADATP